MVEHVFDRPFGWVGSMLAAPVPTAGMASAPQPTTVVPRYSNARGAEDAPRADTPQGGEVDLERCINTMVLRRESRAEAMTVCKKIIGGISG